MLSSPRTARCWPTAYWPITWLCLLVIAAVALQLMQAQLWPQWVYQGLCALGVAALVVGIWLPRRPLAALFALFLGAALLAFGSTGWRASHYAARILPAHLQQRDVVVQGQVMGLPQWLPDGVRFNLAVQHATLNGQTVRLPDTLSLAWYLPRPDDASETAHLPAQPNANPASPSNHRCVLCVQPGELWQMTVRLKQPHGSRNPFGFDYERWLWEQSLGATG